MKKTIALILAMCMVCLLFAACANNAEPAATETSETEASASTATESEGAETSEGSQASEGAETSSEPATLGGEYQRDKVIASTSADGGTFNPFSAFVNWGNVAMAEIMFQKMMRADGEGNIRLEMAKSIEKVDDLNYTVTFWDNIYDSAGNHFTTADAEWCFAMYIDAGHQGGINKFDHMEIIDDYTFTFVLSSPLELGEFEKNFSNCPMLCKAAFEASPDEMTTTPVGTGPVLDSYVPGSKVGLVANEDYWMKNLPEDIQADLWVYSLQNVREIEYQVIQDASSRAIALEMGTTDMADLIDAADIQAFESNDDIATVDVPVDPPVPLIFNCSNSSLCQDVNLRMAICYAVDNAAIAEGLSVPAYPVYGIHPRMFDAPEDWMTGREYYDFNLETAKEYLGKSNYDGEPLTLMYTNREVFDSAGIYLQAQLQAIGVEIKLYSVEESVAQVEKYQDDKWDIRMDILGGGSYLPQTLKQFWSGDKMEQLNGLNIMMIEDKELDALYLALREDNSEENIAAIDDYISFEKCYAYGVCGYYDQTACLSNVEVGLGDRGYLCPNASNFN